MKKQHLILFIYIVLNMYLFSQDLPRIEPLSQYVVLSEHRGDLTSDQFISGALLASGSTRNEKDTQMVKDYISDLVKEVRPIDEEYERGEEILQYLHETLFRHYTEDQTRITTLMTSGTYNCVSSAVLFMAAGRASGLNIQGVSTPDHAFASVIIDNNPVDVETTNEWGFDPGHKKEFSNSFTGSTGYNYVPPGNYSLRKDISDKQMIGLILQNRIAELQRGNNHRSTVPLAVDRYALTLSDDARKDMYDTFSNYASQLNGSGQYEKGITFLKDAILRWNTSQTVTKALEALIHNYILSLMENDNAEEAEVFLNQLNDEGIVSEKSYYSDIRMIYDKRTVDMINSERSFDEILTYLNEVYEQGFLTRDKWINYTLFNYVKEAEIVSIENGWLEAYLFVSSAPLEIRDQRKYLQLLNSCKGNYIITIHNQFADLYNSGKFAEAENIVRQGLNHFPGDRTLTSDLRMIQN
jgi:hypothetical protein